MKLKVIAFLLILLMASFSFAAKEKKEEKRKPRHYAVNLSLFYPLSINKTPYDSVNFNLTLFYGRVGRVGGVDLAAVASVVKDEMKGIQITGAAGIAGNSMSGVQVSGLFNVAGDHLKGLQAAGLINIAGERLKGVQLAGIANIAGDDTSGIQGSGIFNITGESFKGIQATGIFNITGENFVGIQAADIFNVVGEDFSGIQAAGIFNVTGDTFKGLQAAGILNVAGRVTGLQMGMVNVAGKVNGVQLGIVNYTKKEMRGVPIGLVNLSKNGRVRFTSWGSNLTAVNMGVKFMVNKIYSIITVGGINLHEDLSEAVSYGFYYGVHFPMKKAFVDIDAGYKTIDNEDIFKSTVGTRDHHVLSFRGMVGLDISPKFSIFAGAGLGYLWDHGSGVDFADGKTKPLFFAGIELF